MFVWAPIPEPYREMGSLEFASMLVREARWRRRRASASARAATASCGSRSSRTSSASPRPCATSARPHQAPVTPAASATLCATESPSEATACVTGSQSRHGAVTAGRYGARRWRTTSCASGCPIGPVRSARWPAASARCGATSSASRSSSGARAGRSTSWSSRCPRPGSSTCSSPRSPRSTASTSRTSGPSSASRARRALDGPGHGRAHGPGGRRRPGAPRCSAQDICRELRVRLGDGGAASDPPPRWPRGGDAARGGVARRLPRRARQASRRPPTRAGLRPTWRGPRSARPASSWPLGAQGRAVPRPGAPAAGPARPRRRRAW